MTAPDRFEHVTAITRANVYFDGKVVSHGLVTADGQKKTLGLIFPGSYAFNTAAPELMQITAGNCRVKLDGDGAWTNHPAGSSFHVPAQSRFEIAADEICQYVCSFEA